HHRDHGSRSGAPGHRLGVQGLRLRPRRARVPRLRLVRVRQSRDVHGYRADGRRLRHHHLAGLLPRPRRLRPPGRALCPRRHRHRPHRTDRLRPRDRPAGRVRDQSNRRRNRTVNANTDSAALPPEATGASETLFPSGSRRDRPGALALTIGFGLVAVCLTVHFTSPSASVGGAWCIAMMLVPLSLSLPGALAPSVPSIIGVYAVSGIPATMNILATAPFSAVSDWTLSVLPMFIFMGMLLTRSGLSTKIYRVADHWFSWLPGGIGIGTTFAGAGLSAVTGSTIGMTYALGR